MEPTSEPTAVKMDGRKTRWANATPEQRMAHGRKVSEGRAKAKAARETIAVSGPVQKPMTLCSLCGQEGAWVRNEKISPGDVYHFRCSFTAFYKAEYLKRHGQVAEMTDEVKLKLDKLRHRMTKVVRRKFSDENAVQEDLNAQKVR